jgi:hypothetical protein
MHVIKVYYVCTHKIIEETVNLYAQFREVWLFGYDTIIRENGRRRNES